MAGRTAETATARGRSHLRRHADAAHPEAPLRQFLPGRRDRAPPARGPRPRCRRRRDVRHRHEHPQGAEGSREDRRLQALEGPGERHRLEPGPGIEDLYGRPLERLASALRLARRDLRQGAHFFFEIIFRKIAKAISFQRRI